MEEADLEGGEGGGGTGGVEFVVDFEFEVVVV